MRILSTYADHGWVRRRISEGRYELPFSFGKTMGKSVFGHPLVDVCENTLIRLQERIKWPSDIAVCVDWGRIEILETTRAQGALAPNRAGYGLGVSMIQSAHGRAYLAFCSPDERRGHLETLAASGTREERRWIDSGRVDQLLADTVERGYGVREAGYWAEPVDFGPDVAALAVPIGLGKEICGTVNVVWLREQISLSDAASSFSGELWDAADEIFERITASESIRRHVAPFRKHAQ